MTNLIIIGNGFDMAHGLKTSYSSFIEFLVNKKFKSKNLYTDLFDFSPSISPYHNSYEAIIKNIERYRNIFRTKNMFFKRLTNKLFNLNWCDIEREYFVELSNVGKPSYYASAEELNIDFEIVKGYLSEYLKIEQLSFTKVWAYEQYFERISTQDAMILNFNYTNTVSNYVRSHNLELVQIHGELESKENPIIFGFAADDNESRNLLQFEDKEFMRNIKKHNYKRTEEEKRLVEFLDKNQEIEVSIFGHSCGISDKLILNQIFNNKNVSEIRIYYHKNYEHYFETQVNIDIIMNNDNNFRKLINFQASIIIPQKDNELTLEQFSNTTTSMLDKKRKEEEERYKIY